MAENLAWSSPQQVIEHELLRQLPQQRHLLLRRQLLRHLLPHHHLQPHPLLHLDIRIEQGFSVFSPTLEVFCLRSCTG